MVEPLHCFLPYTEHPPQGSQCPESSLGLTQLSSPGSGIGWDGQAESEIMEHKEGTIAGQGRAVESNLGGKPQQTFIPLQSCSQSRAGLSRLKQQLRCS